MPSRTQAFCDADTSTDESRGPSLSDEFHTHLKFDSSISICPDRIGVKLIWSLDKDHPGVAGSAWAKKCGFLKSWSNGYYTSAAGRS